MSTAENIYSTGDWIVHANYGVGQVTGKDNKLLDGEKKTFFKVKTLNSVYWLSLSNLTAKRIRPLASKSQIQTALSLLRKEPEEMDDDHKYRGKSIAAAFKDVSLYAKVRMIRDLNGRKYTKRLNQTEIEALEKLRDLVLNEWSVVNGKDQDELAQKLDKALATSAKKIILEDED